MSYAVDLTKKAAKQLESLPEHARDRMLTAIRDLGDEPFPRGARKITGTEPDTWRIRVGDWRALYRVDEEELVVLVVRIAHRREAYE